MKLNHLNLTVTDVKAAREFLETYFGLITVHTRGDSFAVLSDDNKMVLTLMKGTGVQYPKTFHIGFGQENEEKVNEIHRRLQEGGFQADPPKRLHAWTFYVKAPGGFTVEVFA